MLDNEPTGGPTVGENPIAETAETTTAQKPVRRRATRRAGAAVATETTTPDTPLTSENVAATENAPAPESAAPESAAPETAKAPAKRATRTRKKAVPPAEAPSSDEAPTADAPAAEAPAASDADAEPVKTPAKRASRSRKKAAAVLVEPVTEPAADLADPADLAENTTATATAAALAEADPEADADAEEAAANAAAAEGNGVDATAGQPAGATPTLVAPPVVMFMAPDPVVTAAPASRVANPFAPPVVEEEAAPAPAKRSRSRRKPATTEPAAEVEAEAEASTEVSEVAPGEAEVDGEDEESAERRRRRRGRRGRGRGRGGDELAEGEEGSDDTAETDDAPAAETDDDSTDAADGDDDTSEGGTRRRRRRRRRGSSGGDTELAPDDPPNTVVRVRDTKAAETRSSFEDEVQGVKGSTRLEAKRQRRRDGRDQGRRRPPVLSEAEFLARREAVERVMVVRQQGERTQIAVLEDDILVEHYVTKASSASYAGNVYLGKVQNVLPSMEAAFVDIGKGRNAVLYAGEVNWDSAGMAGKPRKIEQALRSGDPVLVQVTKDPIGHKGARLTSQISLPGRFLVYVPEGQMTGISRKLPENERKRLKDILKKIVPENAGVIIRTAAEGASEEELSRDVARLEAQWQSIKAKADKGNAPALLHAEPDLVIRVIRDIFNEDFSKLVVQGNEAWETVQQYVEHVSPDLVERLSRHTGESDVFHDLRIDEQLTKALDRKVWLPSGGSLVIDRTEAMTVVDVNTGKFTGQGGNLEETVTRNNLEAAEEIVRQLRLRDIGGIIVIDFIDMVLEGNRDLVLRRLTECLGRDRTKHQVAEVTSLGLVQMTRKRVGQGLLEVFSETCEHCRGRGIIIRSEPVGERSKPAAVPAPAAAGTAAVAAASAGGGAVAGTVEPKSRKRRSGRGRGGDAEQFEPVPRSDAEPDAGSEDAVEAAVEPVAQSLNGSTSAGGRLSRGGERGRAERHRVDHVPAEETPAADAEVPAERFPVEPVVEEPSPVAEGRPVIEDEPVAPEPVAPEAVEPATVEPVATVPAPRKRARRAASRPAGPPPTAG